MPDSDGVVGGAPVRRPLGRPDVGEQRGPLVRRERVGRPVEPRWAGASGEHEGQGEERVAVGEAHTVGVRQNRGPLSRPRLTAGGRGRAQDTPMVGRSQERYRPRVGLQRWVLPPTTTDGGARDRIALDQLPDRRDARPERRSADADGATGRATGGEAPTLCSTGGATGERRSAGATSSKRRQFGQRLRGNESEAVEQTAAQPHREWRSVADEAV